MRERGRELRRAKRTPKRNAAWIGLASGGTHIPCVLWDISSTGARLAAPRSNFLPGAFNLLLHKDGSALHVCRVVWRNNGYLGVQFVHGAAAEEALDETSLRRPTRMGCQAAAAKSGPAVPTSALLLPGYGPRFIEQPERTGIRISSIAAVVLVVLLTVTALLMMAGTQDGAAWATGICTGAANFCQHPEWTGFAGGLMGIVYLAIKGMER